MFGKWKCTPSDSPKEKSKQKQLNCCVKFMRQFKEQKDLKNKSVKLT